MQGNLIVKCNGCEKALKSIAWDTADVDDIWNKRINEMRQLLLNHRSNCPFYGKEVTSPTMVIPQKRDFPRASGL